MSVTIDYGKKTQDGFSNTQLWKRDQKERRTDSLADREYISTYDARMNSS